MSTELLIRLPLPLIILAILLVGLIGACFGSFMRWLLAREDAALGQKGRGILSQNVEKR